MVKNSDGRSGHLWVAGMAQAVPITGDITFAGGVQLDTSSAGTATEVLAWTGPGGTGMPVVISDDGSFSGIAPARKWHLLLPGFLTRVR